MMLNRAITTQSLTASRIRNKIVTKVRVNFVKDFMGLDFN